MLLLCICNNRNGLFVSVVVSLGQLRRVSGRNYEGISLTLVLSLILHAIRMTLVTYATLMYLMSALNQMYQYI